MSTQTHQDSKKSIAAPPVNIDEMDALINVVSPASLHADAEGLEGNYSDFGYFGPQDGDETLNAAFKNIAYVDIEASKRKRHPVVIEAFTIQISWKNNNKQTVMFSQKLDDSCEDYWRNRFPKQWDLYKSRAQVQEVIPPISALGLTEVERVTLEAFGVRNLKELLRLNAEDIKKIKLARLDKIIIQAKGFLAVMERVK